MVAQNVVFWILAAGMVLAAIGVVRSQNVVHAALYLVVVLGGGAAQYILLAAEFVAWVQVLIYIGAVIILFLFGIMLTRAPMGGDSDLDNDQRWPAAVVSLFLARRPRDAARRRVLRQGDRAEDADPHRTGRRRASSRPTWCRSRSCRSCCSPRSSAPS